MQIFFFFYYHLHFFFFPQFRCEIIQTFRIFSVFYFWITCYWSCRPWPVGIAVHKSSPLPIFFFFHVSVVHSKVHFSFLLFLFLFNEAQIPLLCVNWLIKKTLAIILPLQFSCGFLTFLNTRNYQRHRKKPDKPFLAMAPSMVGGCVFLFFSFLFLC